MRIRPDNFPYRYFGSVYHTETDLTFETYVDTISDEPFVWDGEQWEIDSIVDITSDDERDEGMWYVRVHANKKF